jgi:predicted pyridoxine 5'-phosphate oxidase superfamily flavin-nucleotide-binding protein
MTPFQHVVGSEAELRALVGTPAARSVLKERKELDQHDRAFIALSPFVLLAATSLPRVTPRGSCRCSIRSGS